MSSNRKQILQGFQLLVQGITDADPQTQIDALIAGQPIPGNPLFQSVQLGVLFAPQVYSSWAEVTFYEGKSGPAGSGGNLVGWRIEDAITIAMTSGWDYGADGADAADAAVAMTNMLAAMDIVLPILHSHVKIPHPTNPSLPVASVYSVLEELPDRAMPVRLPSKHVYLLWHVYVTVRQAYNITLTNP